MFYKYTEIKEFRNQICAKLTKKYKFTSSSIYMKYKLNFILFYFIFWEKSQSIDVLDPTLYKLLNTVSRLSGKGDLNVLVEDLKTWFRKRGYLIKEQVEKAFRLNPSNENNSKTVNDIPLVVTYNTVFKNLSQVIRKNLQLLYADNTISFRDTRNFKSYLVRSKIYALQEKLVQKSVRVNVA